MRTFQEVRFASVGLRATRAFFGRRNAIRVLGTSDEIAA